MPASSDEIPVVAISSRALFDLEESSRMFEQQSVATGHVPFEVAHQA